LEGHAAEVPVVRVNPETLAVEAVSHRYTRLAARRWHIETEAVGSAIEVEVDEHGIVLDYPDVFRRLS